MGTGKGLAPPVRTPRAASPFAPSESSTVSLTHPPTRPRRRKGNSVGVSITAPLRTDPPAAKAWTRPLPAKAPPWAKPSQLPIPRAGCRKWRRGHRHPARRRAGRPDPLRTEPRTLPRPPTKPSRPLAEAGQEAVALGFDPVGHRAEVAALDLRGAVRNGVARGAPSDLVGAGAARQPLRQVAENVRPSPATRRPRRCRPSPAGCLPHCRR